MRAIADAGSDIATGELLLILAVWAVLELSLWLGRRWAEADRRIDAGLRMLDESVTWERGES